MSTTRETYKMAITQVGDMIFMSLPNDGYIELTPEQARTLAGRLFARAAEAEGDKPPKLIVFETREPDATGRTGDRVRERGVADA